MAKRNVKWTEYLRVGDQWLISYASIPAMVAPVALSMIGQALELYLKGAYLKIVDPTADARKFGHSIKQLWDACKNADPHFMPTYQIRDAVLASTLFPDAQHTLSPDDFRHLIWHQELYVVAKYLAHLKYYPTPSPMSATALSFSYMQQNPYWVTFFKELRNCLHYPPPGMDDPLWLHFEYLHNDQVEPGGVAAYLGPLYK